MEIQTPLKSTPQSLPVLLGADLGPPSGDQAGHQPVGARPTDDLLIESINDCCAPSASMSSSFFRARSRRSGRRPDPSGGRHGATLRRCRGGDIVISAVRRSLHAGEVLVQPRLRRIGPIVLAILLALDGCATGKFTTLKPEQLGRVGIVPAPCADVHLGAPPIPGAGAGAKRGAKVGALAMVESGAKVGGTPQSVLLGLAIMALTPVGAGVGAVAGALGAESGEKVASANSTLRAAFPRLDPAHAIRQQLLEVIRARALRSVVLVDEKRVSELTDFAPLEEEGIDTVLELFKITIRLAGPDSPERHINPKYKFKMEIHARLLRPDGSRLHEKTFDVTAERTFVDWAAHDARELVGVTDRATRELAEDIVDRYLRKPVRVDPSLINQTPAIPGRCPPRPTGPELGIPVTRD